MKIIKTQTNNPVDHDTFIHQPDASKTRVANIPGKRLPFPDQIGNYQRNIGTPTDAYQDSKVYIVGGGIAGWRECLLWHPRWQKPAENITILEHLDVAGGSLDGSGNPETGYMVRGGLGGKPIPLTKTFGIYSKISPLLKCLRHSTLDEYSDSK